MNCEGMTPMEAYNSEGNSTQLDEITIPTIAEINAFICNIGGTLLVPILVSDMYVAQGTLRGIKKHFRCVWPTKDKFCEEMGIIMATADYDPLSLEAIADLDRCIFEDEVDQCQGKALKAKLKEMLWWFDEIECAYGVDYDGYYYASLDEDNEEKYMHRFIIQTDNILTFATACGEQIKAWRGRIADKRLPEDAALLLKQHQVEVNLAKTCAKSKGEHDEGNGKTEKV